MAHAQGSAARGARVLRGATASDPLTPRRTRAWSPTRSATTGSCTTVRRVLEPARPAHVRHPSALLSHGPDASAVVWAHNSHSATPRPPRWARAASTTSGSCAGERFGGRRSWSASARTTAPWPPRTTGRARCTSWHVLPSHQRATSGSVTTRVCRRFLLPLRAAGREACASSSGRASRARDRRDLPARDRAGEPLLPRRAAGASSTSTSGSTRPGRWPLRRAQGAGRAGDLPVRRLTGPRSFHRRDGVSAMSPMLRWWFALLGGLCLALAACSGPVGAARVDPKTVLHNLGRRAPSPRASRVSRHATCLLRAGSVRDLRGGGAPGQDAGHQHRGSALERGQPQAAWRSCSCATRPATCSAADSSSSHCPWCLASYSSAPRIAGATSAGRRAPRQPHRGSY